MHTCFCSERTVEGGERRRRWKNSVEREREKERKRKGGNEKVMKEKDNTNIPKRRTREVASC
jgi:hypothetical protein